MDANPQSDLSSVELEQLLERGIEAIWARAVLTLGDVTLTAIVDRVVHTSAEQFPELSSLRVEGSSVSFAVPSTLRARSADLTPAVTFALAELLTVIGNLTAEVLTPALHSALSMVTLDPVVPRKQSTAPKRPGKQSKPPRAR